jgi:uncharacterized 2Fe-2S/4Fe-4S cluster protein (DUF4445 family)
MTEVGREALVVFAPSGRRGRVPVGTSLLEAARQLSVDLDSVCGGRGICGRCRVRILEDPSNESGSGSLSAISEPEQRYARRSELGPDFRLGCHARVQGNVSVEVPVSSRLRRQVVCKPYESRELAVNPVVRLHYVEVPAASFGDPGGDLERLQTTLSEAWGLPRLASSVELLRSVPGCLREGGTLTAAVREDSELVGVWPGFRGRVLGVAVDVGSTTLAAHLCDLSSGEVLASRGDMNPQIRFGDDLMSRVSYAMSRAEGAHELTHTVREALDGLIGELLDEAGASRDEVLELTFVGNPIMHHLLLGISPTALGTAPFTLATDAGLSVPGREIDLDLHAGTRAYMLPCIAGHVGADTAGMLLAEEPWSRPGVTLLVDVGTNAEIVVCGRGRLLAASSPTGPAFEGAQISCGQRSTVGAVERVRIDRQTLEPRLRVIGADPWSDESSFASSLPSCGITGVCGTGIIEAIAELFLAGVIDREGRIDGSHASRTSRIVAEGRSYAYVLHRAEPELRITQHDVRAVQLAKAALYAGIRLLLLRLGVDAPDRIRLAGGFGSQIDVEYALVLGMLPDCEPTSVSSAGNAAGAGAVMALLDGDARRTIEAKVREVEKIELAVDPDFQHHFVAAMGLPHASDRFPHLAKRVILRDPGQNDATVRGRRTRRRARGEIEGGGP